MASKINYKALYPNTRIAGFETIINNLQKEIDKIQGATEEGAIKAMAFVLRKADDTIPIDTGAMRNSKFITTKSGKPVVMQKTSVKTGKDIKKKKIAAKVKSEHKGVVNEMTAEAKGDSHDICIIGGYSAYYSLYVHEMLQNYKLTTPQSRKKWLESTFKENQNKILEIIKEHAIK